MENIDPARFAVKVGGALHPAAVTDGRRLGASIREVSRAGSNMSLPWASIA